MDYQRFELGDFTLESGELLYDAWLAFETHGELNPARDNAILLPTWYTGSHRSWRAVIGAGRALDPSRYFIISVNMFGNGLSSSPSNAGSQGGPLFPSVTIGDNVRAQHRLINGHFHIERLALVAGWSMAAMQGWQWAADYPESVRGLLAVCGSARCWPLNYVFLEGVKAALIADPVFDGGNYRTPPLAGLAAFGRVYAGWAYSAEFFREQLYRTLNFDGLESLLADWERDHQQWDANDLLCMLHTWQQGDISRNQRFGGRWQDALRAIQARTIVMPCDTDSYFTADEAYSEFSQLPNARWLPLHSPYGHCAGAPGRFAAESDIMEQAMKALLQQGD